MSYAQRLMALLRPLGVYTFRDGSFSMAQLEALGAQMDAARAALEKNGRESIVMSAEDEGLDRAQALFRYRAPTDDVPSRRAAVAGLMQVADDAFTLEALQRCLPAGGARGHGDRDVLWHTDGDQGGNAVLIVLLRHGETAYNAQRRYQGASDIPLSEDKP